MEMFYQSKKWRRFQITSVCTTRTSTMLDCWRGTSVSRVRGTRWALGAVGQVTPTTAYTQNGQLWNA